MKNCSDRSDARGVPADTRFFPPSAGTHGLPPSPSFRQAPALSRYIGEEHDSNAPAEEAPFSADLDV
mgnify:CR=1 FL=1